MNLQLANTSNDDSTAVPRRTRTNGEAIAPTDGERLMRFRRYQDQRAFSQVVDAHAAMVWGVCRQVLRHRQDVEDAFQATFMILARKAGSIRANDSAAGWLFRVALRTASNVRQRRRQSPERTLEVEPLAECDQLAAVELSEQRSALLEVLNSLPDRYRQALTLCHLEGLSRSDAAEQLGCSVTAKKGRLARGRRLLRARVVRRGVALLTAMPALAVQLTNANGAVSPTLVAETVRSAQLFTHHSTASIDGAAASVAKQEVLAMSIFAASKPTLGVFAAGVVSILLAAAVANESPDIDVLSAGKSALDLAKTEGDVGHEDGAVNLERITRLAGSGAISASDVHDAEIARADVMLLMAEVKHCESKAAGIRWRLDRQDNQSTQNPLGASRSQPNYAAATPQGQANTGAAQSTTEQAVATPSTTDGRATGESSSPSLPPNEASSGLPVSGSRQRKPMVGRVVTITADSTHGPHVLPTDRQEEILVRMKVLERQNEALQGQLNRLLEAMNRGPNDGAENSAAESN